MKKNNRKRGKQPKPFDSWLEFDLYQGHLSACSFHPPMIEYTQTRKYEPDFVIEEEGKTIFIETKGRFRDRQESRKYVDVAASLSDNEELVFIFMNSKLAMPHVRRRKDGTKLSHGDFAAKNNISFYDLYNIPTSWRK